MSDEKRPISIDDVTQIKTINDPQISPDGQWVAYVVTTPNLTKKGYDNNIYLVSTSGGAEMQITRSGKDTSPAWSPDGSHLAFVSSRNEKPQIYILPVTVPGEPRQLTSHENGAFAPAWSPDGSEIAYLSRVNVDERTEEDSDEKPEPPKDELEGKQRKERKAEDYKQRFDPRMVRRIPYRSGTAFLDDRHSQIYVIAVDEDLDEDTAKPRRLTNAEANYAPPIWSKSGRHIVTTRAWDTEADENDWVFRNIYLIEMASGIERRIKDDDFSYYAAMPSYDGDWLLTYRTPRGQTDALTRIALVPLEGSGDITDLNMELSRPPSSMDWLEDGSIMAGLLTTGRVEIHSIDPKTKTFTPIVNDEQSIWAENFSKAGDAAYVSRTTNRLDELFFKPADGDPVQLTNVNSKYLDEVTVQDTHEVWFKNPDGDDIQGWYIFPPDFEEGKKYPLALNIHGGPHVMWTPSSRAMWHEWQTHAAAGYVVFFCNPRGSDGYGQDHMAAIHGNWGEVTMTDIMAGVDAMIAKGFVDESRMAITGGSFGGYMTAWIIGHTDRFASAVPQRGVYNLSAFYGTSDVPILMSSEFDAEPWEDRDKYWQHSPLAYAHLITTPTLIIHSDNDFRVPISDGEQLFAWIRRATDTPVTFIRYPREGHELSRSGEPAHRIHRLTEMVKWFDTYCQPEKLEADD